MPDGDVIRRGVRHAWRPAYKALRSGESGVDAKGFIGRSLSAALKSHGIPHLREAADLVQNVWTGRISTTDAMRRTASVSGVAGGTRVNSLLDAALRFAIVGGATGARADQAVAESFLKTLVDADLLSKLRPAMLEDHGRTPAEVEAIVAGFAADADEAIRAIAQQLVADPTASQLRSPPSRRRRKRTVELLDESV